MSKIFLISIFILTFCIVSNAQSKAPSPNEVRACGKIILKGHPVEIMNVRSALSGIKTKCKKGVLVDEKNKTVVIVRNYCEPGIPPRPGDGRAEARRTSLEAIEKLKQTKRVITYSCYPPRP